MVRRLWIFVLGFAVLASVPAQARFGKTSSRSSSSTSSSPSSSSSSSSTHSASPVGSGGGSGVGGGYASGYSRGYGYRPHYSLGFWSGAFIPRYGYGYGYSAPGVVTTQAAPEEPQAESTLRVSAGLEAQGYLTGFTLAAMVGVEGERWGFTAGGQNISVKADDGSGGFDNLQTVSAHITFAFLTGQYGRLRFEGGADAVFAPDLIVLGPTGGFSGSLYIGGPFALEGAVMVTPWPFVQVDYKVGAAVGLGPVGIRAGWRTQTLDDRGLVDGVAHRDVFMGPYVGASIVF
jgi:hypothetical protein